MGDDASATAVADDPVRTRATLEAAGVPLTHQALVDDANQAGRAAEQLGGDRFVVKAGGLVHKSDHGGVVLDRTSPQEVTAAAQDLLERIGPGAAPIVVQPHHEGREMLVGLRRDPRLGAVVVVGMGGVEAEVFNDVVYTMVPAGAAEIRARLADLRVWPLLTGFRGTPPRDIDALIAVAVAVAGLGEREPDIVELDLNPVRVGVEGEGAVAVDARIVRDAAATARPAANRRPAVSSLDPLLRPRSIAVVGVSDDHDKFGAKVFRYLRRHDFLGPLAAINPAGGQIDGRPRLAALDQLDEAPDLVISAVPSRATIDVAHDAVAAGAKAMLVHSSDFAEIGPEGAALQDELVAVTRTAGIRLAGPNSMGVVAPAHRLASSISAGLDRMDLRAGSIAVVTSSGALGSCVATRLMHRGTGVSHWIHAGNEVDVSIADYLAWLAEDPDTRAVGLLLENITDGAALIDAGRRLAAAGKPVLAYTMARTDGGQQAALSHTGAMIGPAAIRDAVLSRAGMARVDTLEQLEDGLRYLDAQPLPGGRRLAALTFSGGACAVVADSCTEVGLELPGLSDGVAARIRELVPDFAAVRNPVDVSFQLVTAPERFRDVVAILAHSTDFDAVLVQFTTNADPAAVATADAVLDVRRSVDTPIYVSRFGGDQLAPDALARYRAAGVPLLDAPDRAVRAIAAVADAAELIRAAR